MGDYCSVCFYGTEGKKISSGIEYSTVYSCLEVDGAQRESVWFLAKTDYSLGTTEMANWL